jgi:hypothetical protein
MTVLLVLGASPGVYRLTITSGLGDGCALPCMT